MRDAILLGSGRSGTSMLAGTLARAGWFSGARPYPPRSSNPKGFFESPDVNGVNEALLARALPERPVWQPWHRWLATPPHGAAFEARGLVADRIAQLVTNRPFAFKDPRFCWTLPAWAPYVDDALRVCVFRDPAVTARSIVKECRNSEYLAGVPMSFARALEIWHASYAQVLRHVAEGDWVFLHYDQLIDGSGFGRLEAGLGAPVDRDFPDRTLRRTRCIEAVPEEVAALYGELCGRAEHEPESLPAVLASAAEKDEPLEPSELAFTVVVAGDDERVKCTLSSLACQTAPASCFEVLCCGRSAEDMNRALAEARGKWVLFLDDEVVATPTLIEEHRRAHHTLGDRKVCVRGATEPVESLLGAPIVRYMLSVGELLPASAANAEVSKWTHFRTTNLSVSLEALRDCGGLDAAFQPRVVRDAALGLALEGAGYKVAFHAGARTTWLGARDVPEYREERRALAAATWRLIARYPQALQYRSLRSVARVDADELEAYVDDRLPQLDAWERAATALAKVDLFSIDPEQRDPDGTATELATRFSRSLRELETLTWHAELATGLRHSEASCLAELGLPWHLDTSARRRYLAWPRYDSALDLDVLMTDWADALAQDEEACLCLRCDPELDPPLAEAEQAIQAAYARHQRGDTELEVLFVAEPLGPGPWLRLGQAVMGVLRLPSSRDADRAPALSQLGVRQLDAPGELTRPREPKLARA